jgi:L-asparaginase II
LGIRTDINSILTGAAPLFAMARRGVAEVVISGVCYFKVEGQRLQGSDPNVVLIARSLLKPWQFLAADIGRGDKATGLEADDSDESFWAMGLASHSGQPHHMEQIAKLCEVAGAGENELFCPRGYPLDPAISSVMQNSGILPSRMHHPCSGKHLVQLAACRRGDFPKDYWNPEHPLQKRLGAIIGQQVGEKPIWMTDSCGLPTLAITAKAHVNMWERLALSDDPKIRRLRALWTNNIRLVGGYGRLESDLMEVSKGRIIAKEGADGLLVVSALAVGGEPAATCLVKLASGYSSTYLALALWSILSTVPAADLPPTFALISQYLKSRLEKWVPGDQELVLPPFEKI